MYFEVPGFSYPEPIPEFQSPRTLTNLHSVRHGKSGHRIHSPIGKVLLSSPCTLYHSSRADAIYLWMGFKLPMLFPFPFQHRHLHNIAYPFRPLVEFL